MAQSPLMLPSDGRARSSTISADFFNSSQFFRLTRSSSSSSTSASSLVPPAFQLASRLCGYFPSSSVVHASTPASAAGTKQQPPLPPSFHIFTFCSRCFLLSPPFLLQAPNKTSPQASTPPALLPPSLLFHEAQSFKVLSVYEDQVKCAARHKIRTVFSNYIFSPMIECVSSVGVSIGSRTCPENVVCGLALDRLQEER